VPLLRLLDATQREPGGAAGLVSRQSTTPMLVLEQQEMRGDLAFESGLLATRSHDVEKSPEEPLEVTRHSASLDSSRFTRVAERCHRSI
jgi:hypothetical protein